MFDVASFNDMDLLKFLKLVDWSELVDVSLWVVPPEGEQEQEPDRGRVVWLLFSLRYKPAFVAYAGGDLDLVLAVPGMCGDGDDAFECE